MVEADAANSKNLCKYLSNISIIAYLAYFLVKPGAIYLAKSFFLSRYRVLLVGLATCQNHAQIIANTQVSQITFLEPRIVYSHSYR